MAQNVYDDAAFFDAYAGLPRSIDGLDAAPEWPALRAMLPPLGDLRVLDLGCGYGWFSRWAVDAGAASVLGVDVSEKMLDRAIADTDDERITYRRADLDRVVFDAGSSAEERFDLVYSSLTLHYLTDLDRLFGEVASTMATGDRFVYSVEHPIFTAPSSPAFVSDAVGHATWPLDQYFLRGERVTDWLAPGVVKHHRTIGDHVAALHGAGFAVTDLVEWCPSPSDLAEHPDWATELDRPMFLLLAATRR